MTAPDNLSAWKDGLLRELMLRTRAHFRGDGADGAATRPQRRDRAKACRSRASGDGMRAATPRARSSTASIRGCSSQLTPRQTARHVQLAATARAQAPPVALEVHCFPMKGHSELAIVAPDAPGVLAAIAGALTANRVDVLGAVLGHVDLARHGGSCIDVFYVRDLKGEAIPDDDRALAASCSPTCASCSRRRPIRRRSRTLIAQRRPTSGLPQARHARASHRDPASTTTRPQATIVEVVHARSGRRAVRDHADARRPRPRHLAREGLDRGREGRRRVLRDPRRQAPHRRARARRARRSGCACAVEAPGLTGVVSAVDLPPGIGLRGTPLGAVPRAARARAGSRRHRWSLRRRARRASPGASVSRHPYRRQRRARRSCCRSRSRRSRCSASRCAARELAITRDGVRWGWDALSFTQQASRIVDARTSMRDGVALEAQARLAGGSSRRATGIGSTRSSASCAAPSCRSQEHAGKAPLRARLQSYGRFLDALLVGVDRGRVRRDAVERAERATQLAAVKSRLPPARRRGPARRAAAFTVRARACRGARRARRPRR